MSRKNFEAKPRKHIFYRGEIVSILSIVAMCIFVAAIPESIVNFVMGWSQA